MFDSVVISQAGGFLALLPSLFGLGSGIAGAIKQGISGSPADAAVKNAQDQSGKVSNSGGDLLREGASTSAPAKNFFSSILGNREQALSAMAPEVSTIVDQYDAAKKTAAEFSPRGGGRATLNNELPFREAGKIGSLVAGARGNAATQLNQTGLAERQLGAGLTSTGLQGIISGARLGQGQQEFGAQQWSKIGAGLGNSLSALISAGQKNKDAGKGFWGGTL
jgi:hypothetical protein